MPKPFEIRGTVKFTKLGSTKTKRIKSENKTCRGKKKNQKC